jgi:pSer/pThr/pTyr-binding forkhead associated (FHA) protein
MIQFKILSGKQAGHIVVARRFPFQLGRATTADLSLSEPGVWERHASLRCLPDEGFSLDAEGDALVVVNGATVKNVILRNGDVVDLGGAKIQFWLSDVRSRNQRLRAGLVWAGLLLFLCFQLALIARFLR